MDAVYIQVKYTALIHINIDENYKIIGNVQNIKTEVKEYVPYFYSRSNIKGLDASLSILDPWAVSYLNNMLDQGLQMPLPDWLLAPMRKPRFKQYQGYFLFDT